jgi:hypothetical protein
VEYAPSSSHSPDGYVLKSDADQSLIAAVDNLRQRHAIRNKIVQA